MDEIPLPSMGCHLLNRVAHRFYADGETQVLEIELDDSVRGPGGSLHGAIIATLVDVAGSYAIYEWGQRPSSSTSLNVQYLAAGRAGPIRAMANVLRASKTTGVAEVRVVDHGRDDRLMAVGTVMVTFLDGDTWKPVP